MAAGDDIKKREDSGQPALHGVIVVKSDGEEEVFDPAKLRASLEHAGASEEAVLRVLAHVQQELKPRMSTWYIYRHAFSLLARMEKPAASRYSLKRAILDLGPSGFPFEDYIAAIFRGKGYETRSRVLVKGACGHHELDLVAAKDGKCIAAEIKFHNDAGLKSDMKIALYIRARFLDIVDHHVDVAGLGEIQEGWAITNTKFTEDARSYAGCAGLPILDWSSPSPGNLQDWIEETRSHPLTCLTTLSRAEKTRFLANGVVLCNALGENPDLLRKMDVPQKKVDSVLNEVENLCTPAPPRSV
jgi:hypothetical protein